MAKKKQEAAPTQEQPRQEQAEQQGGMEGSQLPRHLTPVAFTGPKPKIGRSCIYWFATSELTGGQLRPRPATLVGFERDRWVANIQRFGSIYSKSGLQFSDTPRHDCLTLEMPE